MNKKFKYKVLFLNGIFIIIYMCLYLDYLIHKFLSKNYTP